MNPLNDNLDQARHEDIATELAEALKFSQQLLLENDQNERNRRLIEHYIARIRNMQQLNEQNENLPQSQQPEIALLEQSKHYDELKYRQRRRNDEDDERALNEQEVQEAKRNQLKRLQNTSSRRKAKQITSS